MEGCGGGEKRALAAQLAQVLSMVKELEARMDQDLPAAARELCGELASSVDRSIRIARSVDGSPRGDGAQHPGGGNAQSKRRKATPCVRSQVRVASVQDMAPLEDGLSWRKYGQKDILGAMYPRAYFRCTHRHSQGCHATKHVQRADGDPLLYDVVYHGAHTCVQAAHPTAEQLRRQLQPGGHADAAGQEQSSPLEPETDGLQPGLLEPMTPYSFAPAPGAGAGADFGGGFPPSPTGLEWQLRSSHAAGGLGVGMDYEPQFAEYFTNAADPFQWEYQEDYLNLYATN